jgi:hypothetical protein
MEVPVQLKKAWRGWPQGKVLRVSPGVANLWVERMAVADYANEQPKPQPKPTRKTTKKKQ